MVTKGFSSSRGLTLAAATIAAAASLGLAGAASASTVIYSDNFVQASGTQLNGQTVESSATYAGGTAGAAWTGDTNVTTTGSNGAYFDASTSGGHAGTSDLYLPFAPVAGYNYTLTETLSLGTTATNTKGWLAAGFAPSPSTDTSTTSGGGYFYNANSDWALVRPTVANNTPKYFGGPGNNNYSVNFGTTADSGTQTLVITLNTSAAAWTGSAMIQGDPSHPSPTFTYTTNPTITDVALGAWSDPGTISNFSLTATPVTAVPEPASLALVGVGALGLLLLKKRKASA
ncbi:MAG: PEP-CTERM sorting domain-containing protein [Phycisphaerae bacterium]